MTKVVAAIPAGGEGTRLRPYTEVIPKPMIPIGIEEKPVLEYVIKWLKKFGIDDIVLLVGYRWKQIRNYFGDGSRFGVNIRYSIDNDNYRGTGGALLNAFKNGFFDSDIVLVWYGDIIAPIDVSSLIAKHIERKADIVIVLANRYKVPVGVAKVDKDKVIGFEEKPWINLYVSLAILTITPQLLTYAEDHLGTSFDIMGDLIPWMVSRGFNVIAYEYHGSWYDIGGVEQYKKLCLDDVKIFVQE
ncbi:MAG: nucleotidyltransferase family protein [Ignisphaera sp.]|uniref:Nucleotidyltransferase family protein n=1 Tax=Ignisphaera aggregans TaxID=334771 RepID=A0A7J3MY02_9CREN